MLSDIDIRRYMDEGHIVLDPLPLDKDIQPTSIDVHLHEKLLVEQLPRFRTVDPRRPIIDPDQVWIPKEGYVMQPGAFALGALAERLTIDSHVVARIEGKSSIGRYGLAVHITAGFVDPGWTGRLTIELANIGPWSILLLPGMPIAQLAFDALETPASRLYGDEALRSRYQGSEDASASRGVNND